MDTQNNPQKIADNVVVSLDYTLVVDGEPYESSKESGPIEFIQGLGSIIPGLENELYGLAVGDQKLVNVPAEQAYGVTDPEAIIDVPRDQFPPEIPLEVGVDLQVRDVDGEPMEATILSIDDENVKLDFNHPLAGKNLTFDVTVISLRSATEEEMAHGHVHSEDGMVLEDDDFDDEDLFEDEDEELLDEVAFEAEDDLEDDDELEDKD